MQMCQLGGQTKGSSTECQSDSWAQSAQKERASTWRLGRKISRPTHLFFFVSSRHPHLSTFRTITQLQQLHTFTINRMSGQHPLQAWLTSVGVQLHPTLNLEQDPQTGLSFYTTEPLPRDTTVIQVPKALCITSTSALDRIQVIFGALNGADAALNAASLPAPDWILLYLVLSRLAEGYLATQSEGAEELKRGFAHLPYVAHIPKVIETPLHFSPAELSLLANTPLIGSTERRLRETIVDYERARSLVTSQLSSASEPHPFASYLLKTLEPTAPTQSESDPLMAHHYHRGLELWRWAESAFTSRSFPPRLIGLSDHRDASTQGTTTSAPILIPGYDTFNHARAHPVTWSYAADSSANSCTDAGGMVCMTLNYDCPAAPCQVYNNYGGKSNEEFLSGYGFTLDTVSEDTLALKLGAEAPRASEPTEAKTHYWIIPPASTTDSAAPQDGAGEFIKAVCPCPSLLSELELRVLQGDERPTSHEDQLELYASVLETLEALLLSKRKAFRTSQKHIDTLAPPADPLETQRKEGWHRTGDVPDAMRDSVWSNVMRYRGGQMHLMNHAVEWTRGELGRVADALDALEDGDSEC